MLPKRRLSRDSGRVLDIEGLWSWLGARRGNIAQKVHQALFFTLWLRRCQIVKIIFIIRVDSVRIPNSTLLPSGDRLI